LQIWLKTPIPAPNICVFGGFWPLNIIFRHRDPQKAHPWANSRRLRYTSRKSVHPFLLYRRRQEKKGKEREGKVHKVTSRLYFTNMGSRPPWTDFHKNWHGCNRNQSLQVWVQYFEGFQIYRRSKFSFSHWLCWSSLQQCCRYRAACDCV